MPAIFCPNTWQTTASRAPLATEPVCVSTVEAPARMFSGPLAAFVATGAAAKAGVPGDGRHDQRDAERYEPSSSPRQPIP